MISPVNITGNRDPFCMLDTITESLSVIPLTEAF